MAFKYLHDIVFKIAQLETYLSKCEIIYFPCNSTIEDIKTKTRDFQLLFTFVLEKERVRTYCIIQNQITYDVQIHIKNKINNIRAVKT